MDKISSRAWFAAIALFLAQLLSYADRTILSLLVEPLKADLAISDVQIGLLLGISFALFYTILGVPIAVLADRGNRTRIILIGMGLWTLATAACGLARTFGMLFLARVGVGVGEAALAPSAYSLLADLFPRRVMARAYAIFNAGIYAGIGLSLIVGGAVTGLVMQAGPVELPLIGLVKPWQMAFIAMGLIGMPFLILIALIPEPPRQSAPPEQISMVALGHHAARTVPFLATYGGGMILLSTAGLAYSSWMPTILIRVHEWSLATTGLVVGLIMGVVGTISMLVGPFIAERWQQKTGARDTMLRLMALCAVCEGTGGLLLASADARLVVLGFTIYALFSSLPVGCVHAVLQLTTPPRLRAKMASMYLLINNLIGLGLGPLIVAVTTERIYGSTMAVGYSVATVGFVLCSGGFVFFLLCRKHFVYTLARAESEAEAAVAVPA